VWEKGRKVGWKEELDALKGGNIALLLQHKVHYIALPTLLQCVLHKNQYLKLKSSRSLNVPV
jgi:hypothetical protein